MPFVTAISSTKDSPQNVTYRKGPKFSDARNFAVIHLKFKQKIPNLKVFCQKHANGIANSEDPDKTAPRSSLIWVCTVCPDLSVRKFRIKTLHRRQSIRT